MASSSNRPPIAPDVSAPPGEGNLFSKAAQGRYGDISKLDAIDAAKLLEYAPGGQFIRGGLELAEGHITSDEEYKWLKDAGIDLNRAKSYSKRARRKLESLDNRPMDKFIHYAFVAAIGVVGGIGGGVLGGWIGGLAGTVAAGYVAEKIYSCACEKHEQDGVKRAADDSIKQRERLAISKKKGIPLSDVQELAMADIEAAATLYATLPEKLQAKYLNAKLLSMADTEDLAEALTTSKGQAAIRVLMKDRALENIVRAYVHIPIDGQNPDKSVYRQYAQLINSGKLDARAIVLEPKTVTEVARDEALLALHRSSEASGDPDIEMPNVPSKGKPVLARHPSA